MVQMFEWRFQDIAKECEDFLGPNGYGAVQIPPIHEHVILVRPSFNNDVIRPWYERYQVVSYKIASRSGNADDVKDMIARCNKAGVRIIADAVINHMTAGLGEGTGIGGTAYDSDNYNYPGVPYVREHFNSKEKCGTQTGGIDDYDDPWQSRVCELVGLHDLDQSHPHVRAKITEAMNEIISFGVSGFRIDATKHIFPKDLLDIFAGLNNLTTDEFEPNSRPFMFHELSESDRGPGKITTAEYFPTGRILEFRYVRNLQESFRKLNRSLSDLWDFGHAWGMMPSDTAISFIDNHDIQRGHNGDFRSAINFRDERLLKTVYTYIMSWPYGLPKVMSSYQWDQKIIKSVASVNPSGSDIEDQNDWIGAPHDENYNIKPVTTDADGKCGNDWICEHRWKEIAAMVKFRNVVGEVAVNNWWDGKSKGNPHHIAYSRGNKGFVAINNDDNNDLKQKLKTGLASGVYCDVISGELKGNNEHSMKIFNNNFCYFIIDNKCTGKEVTVDELGWADVNVGAKDSVPAVAIHVDSKISQ